MSENNDEFNSLRQLLALKRHETPPPGYFEDFSSQIIGRLKSGAARRETPLVEKLAGEAPWLLRFIRSFQARPMLVGGLAGALSLILVGGIIYSGDNDLPSVASGLNPSLALAAPAVVPVANAQTAPQLLASVSTPSDSGGLTIATNYSLQPVPSMFGTQPSPLTQPVSFSPDGN